MYVAPEFNKPETPGVHLGHDNVLGLYHIVKPEDDFIKAAQDVFALLKESQEKYPECTRVLYLDIEGHRGDIKGFDPDFFEFQQEFLQGYLGPFFQALDTPLSSVFNPNDQRNDVPDQLDIG